MKRLLCLIIATVAAAICARADVRVLSIGISSYPQESGWNSINGCNDADLVTSSFPNAVVLKDSAATHRGISDALRRLLQRSAMAGDTVIVHFSGHGQQIVINHSENEPDGLDEAIVPYDAMKRKSASYSGVNHLTDNDFGKIIDSLRAKVGSAGLVIAVIDACHSDSMDKNPGEGKEVYRGTYEIFGAENLTDNELNDLKRTYHNQDHSPISRSPEMGNVVYLSACRSDQRNYEIIAHGKGYGSLTYYFCKAYEVSGLTDMGEFLSAVYSGMEKDKTLRFHGQRPVFRNTLGWEAPEREANRPVVFQPQPSDTAPYPAIAIITAGIIAVILMILWTTKKRKR